jgi:hypothetical protein
MGNRILKKLLEEDSMKNYEWKPWQSAGVKPEYQPRRAFGTRAVDWQEGINFERLRKERLAKLQTQMKKNDTSALLLYRGDNRNLEWNVAYRRISFLPCDP